MTRIAEQLRGWLALPVVHVMLAAGVLGAAVALTVPIPWPDALEPAQVLAGVVHYPPDAPVYLYSTTTWTMLHQAAGLLLAVGITERQLAMIVTTVSGILSFQALALTVWTFAEQRAIAIAAPLFIYFTNATNASVTYPVALIGSPATYGMIGINALLLTLALIAAGRYRSGAWLLGLLPCIHPTIGGWAWIVVSVALALARHDKSTITDARRAWRWFFAGATLAVLSAVAHFARYPFVTMAPGQQAHYLRVFVTFWDSHSHLYGGERLVAAACLAGFYLLLLRDAQSGLTAGARFMCRCILLGALLGSAWWMVGFIQPVDTLRLTRSLMPSRLINLPIMTGMAIVVGLLARERARWAAATLFALAAVVCDSGVTQFTLAALGAAIGVWTVARWRGVSSPFWSGSAVRAWHTAAILLMCVPAPILIARSIAERADGPPLTDRTNNAFLGAIAARPGMLLTAANLHLLQAVTRRPVLVDGGGIDALGYVPQMGPRLEIILRDVYGISLIAPGFSEPQGELPPDTGRALWAQRTPSEWAAIANTYHVTDVLTPDDWDLHLPLITHGEGLRLYTIPQPPPAGW